MHLRFLLRSPAARGPGCRRPEIDHVTKDREGRGRWSIGAQHKLAGIAAAYTTNVIEPLSRSHVGKINVKLSKDRHGHVGRRGVIAIVVLAPEDGGHVVRIVIEPPDSSTETGEFRPTALTGRTSRIIEETPGLTKSQVRQCAKGNTEAGDLALRLLMDEGYVRVELKGKQRRLHYSMKPFREGVRSRTTATAKTETTTAT